MRNKKQTSQISAENNIKKYVNLALINSPQLNTLFVLKQKVPIHAKTKQEFPKDMVYESSNNTKL